MVYMINDKPIFYKCTLCGARNSVMLVSEFYIMQENNTKVILNGICMKCNEINEIESTDLE